jgi:hypothetical protein
MKTLVSLHAGLVVARSLLAIIALASQCATALAAPAPEFICPPSIPISSTPPAGMSPNWKVYIASELYLNSATPISGPPEMHGDLADYVTRLGKKEWSYVYDLDREFSDGKWLECGYGTHNEVTLSQRMPDAIKTCTFTYRKGAKAGQHDIKIQCR